MMILKQHISKRLENLFYRICSARYQRSLGLAVLNVDGGVTGYVEYRNRYTLWLVAHHKLGRKMNAVSCYEMASAGSHAEPNRCAALALSLFGR